MMRAMKKRTNVKLFNYHGPYRPSKVMPHRTFAK